MDAAYLMDRLDRLPDALDGLLSGLSAEDAARRGPGGAWSIVEVVNHLIDEDVEDFGARLFSTLEDAGAPWAPIDPEGAAEERGYRTRDLSESLIRFRSERVDAVARLRTLKSPDWGAAHQHPKFGAITAGDLLASWAAHDALHLRQIAKRLFELTQERGRPGKTDYAGSWSA